MYRWSVFRRWAQLCPPQASRAPITSCTTHRCVRYNMCVYVFHVPRLYRPKWCIARVCKALPASLRHASGSSCRWPIMQVADPALQVGCRGLPVHVPVNQAHCACFLYAGRACALTDADCAACMRLLACDMYTCVHVYKNMSSCAKPQTLSGTP